jgi:hypothetical protein
VRRSKGRLGYRQIFRQSAKGLCRGFRLNFTATVELDSRDLLGHNDPTMLSPLRNMFFPFSLLFLPTAVDAMGDGNPAR